MNTAEIIYDKVKMLPDSTASEVLEFVEFLEPKRKKLNPSGYLEKDSWLAEMWGCSPDFPDRLPDPLPEPVNVL